MRVLTIFSLLLLLAACQSKDRHETIASELCQCMEPLAKQYDRVNKMADSGETEDIQALLTDLEDAADESEACAERLEEKYGDLENEKEAVEKAMKTVCPDIAAMIEELEGEVE